MYSADENDTVTPGSSLSTIVRVLASGSVTPSVLDAVPDTDTVSPSSSKLSSVAIMVTVPVLVVAPVAMVRVLLVLSVKSSATAGDTAVADTVTVVGAPEARFKLAVTVLESPSSIENGDSESDTLGGSTVTDSGSPELKHL